MKNTRCPIRNFRDPEKIILWALKRLFSYLFTQIKGIKAANAKQNDASVGRVVSSD